MKTRILIQRHCGVVSASWVMLSLIFLLMATAAQSDQSGDFSYEQTGSAITITKYTGADGAVSIPSTINGLPVTSIGDWAFYDCTNLTSITISNGVGSIGDATFFGCGRLANIRIPNTVTNIGDAAFFGCGSLTRTTIPENVTSIGGYAFYGCSNLRSVYFHGNAPSIGSDVFSGDNNVTVYYQHDSTGWDSTFGGRLSAPWPFDYTTNNGTITIARYTGSGGEVSIPDTIDGMPVTTIGAWAFMGCTNLTSVTIPNSVTSIAEDYYYGSPNFGLFLDCIRLIAITVDAQNSFYSSVDGVLFDKSQKTLIRCPMGKSGSYTIPNSAASIANAAFYNCTGLTNVTTGNSVTNIGMIAFYGCANLTNITIPHSVTSIGSWAFYGCANLTSIMIPNGVTSISWAAFENCASLTAITIPNSVTTIDAIAFVDCTSLTNMAIPNSVTNIGWYAFYGCTSLSAITVDVNNPSYSSADGVLFDKNQTSLLNCPAGKGGSYTIPNRVNSIAEWGFSGCASLTDVTIPNSVTNIGTDAFDGCHSLTGIFFYGNAPSADSSAFYDAPNATVYYLPGTTNWGSTFCGLPTKPWYSQVYAYATNNGVITITRYTGPGGDVTIPATIDGLPVTSIGDWAFYDCTNLTSITISNGVGSIGDATFFGCGRLANIRIPNTVTNIGEAAFFDCGSLTSITIPESITSIGGYAFYGCANLRSVYFHGSPPSIGSDVFSGDNNVTVYYEQDSIGWESAFGGRTSAPWPFDYTTNNGTITIARYTGSGGDVSIPDTIDGMPVTSIGHGAFYGCCGLTNITIPNSVTSIGGGTYGTHYGREGAFAGCTNLTSVTIGNGVTSIGNFAFFRCTALTSITIPNSVTSIGYGAFSGSSNLIGVTISDSLSNIEDFAFSDCTSLTNITIPTSVTSIGRYSLGGCTSLTSITIPYSVTNIAAFVDEYGEHGAFLGCANLREITVDTRNSFYSSVDGVLFSKSQTTLVQCPEAKSGNYTIPNGVIRIGDGAFSGCARLASVIIANSVTNIGYWAFSDCTNLTSITLPDSITRIGAFAFSGCINLIRVNFQGNVPNFASYLPFNYNGPPIFDVFGNNVTVYYLPKTTGWGTTLVYGYWMDDINGPPTMLWKPQMQARNASFGVGSNQFGFNINWASGQVVVVETCTNLTNPVWYPIQTNTLTGDSSYFSDPQWTNYPTRFYRLRPL